MVNICIVSESKIQAEEIINFLLKGKYISNLLIVRDSVLAKIDAKNRISRLDKTILSGIIKTVQFNVINEQLKKMYRSNMPVLYSIPIIQMDEEQSEMIVDYRTSF